jgi:hypothetical protein
MKIFWKFSDQFQDRSYSLNATISYDFSNFEGMFEDMVADEGKDMKPVELRFFRAFISKRKSNSEMYYLSISVLGSGQNMKCYFYTLEGARKMAERVLKSVVANLHKVEVEVDGTPLPVRDPNEIYMP